MAADISGTKGNTWQKVTSILDQTELKSGDDAGINFENEVSVGTPLAGKEFVAGGGDSYGVGLETGTLQLGSAWHCDTANTSGTTITSAVDVTAELSSDSGSTENLFGGTSTGAYLLLGSDAIFRGVKAKVDTGGIAEPDSFVNEYLASDDNWVQVGVMATGADFPYMQYGNNIGLTSGTSEHWRYGFNPDYFPDVMWEAKTLNINGTNYTKYWARLRLTGAITSDILMEQIKLHTDRFEVNVDGTTEYFGTARYPKTLISGVDRLINNTVASPANQDVTYDSGTTVADYTDNQFNNNTVDSALLVQNIETGIDTSIPLRLDISFYVEGTGTGDVEWEADVYEVTDGYVYDGSDTPKNYSTIAQVITPSNLKRQTASIWIDVDYLTDNDALLIKLFRDATSGNADDTITDACVITNVRLTGFFWRP